MSEGGHHERKRTQTFNGGISYWNSNEIDGFKDFLDEGLNIAAIKREYAERQDKAHQKQKSLTDADVRRILQDELRNQGRFSAPSQYISNWRI